MATLVSRQSPYSQKNAVSRSAFGCGAVVKLAIGAVAAIKVAKVGLAVVAVAKKGAVAAAFVGKLGGYALRARVAAVEARFAGRGFETVAGGSFKAERKYGSRFPDLVMRKAGYGEIAVNVGRKTRKMHWRASRPVARERRALADFQNGGY
jgi:hypothetical protein